MNLTGEPARRLQDFARQVSQTDALPLGEQRFHRTDWTANFHIFRKSL
jgi:hypothetical protein